MSDSAPSRPQPKPRPRPRPVAVQPPHTGNATSSSTAATSNIPLGEIVINDSDDLFVINRGRTKETWKKLGEINKGLFPFVFRMACDLSSSNLATVRVTSDSESDAGPSTPLRKRPKRQGTPKWQQNQNALRCADIDCMLYSSTLINPPSFQSVIYRNFRWL